MDLILLVTTTPPQAFRSTQQREHFRAVFATGDTLTNIDAVEGSNHDDVIVAGGTVLQVIGYYGK